MNHPSDRCFNKPKEEETVEKANKAQKKKKKQKKKGAEKASMRALIEEDESDDEDLDSEEPSPVKRTVARAEVARSEVALPRKSVADRIKGMNPEQREDFKKEMKTAFIAKAARGRDNAHLPCRAYTKLNGGRSAKTDGVFD